MIGKIYEVYLWEKVTQTVLVSADSEEEAIEMAEELAGEDTGVSQGYHSQQAFEQK